MASPVANACRQAIARSLMSNETPLLRYTSRFKKEAFMMSKGMLLTTLGCFGAIVVLGQAPAPTAPAAPQQGPGVQAPADARYAEYRAKCKTPPAQRGGGGARAGAPAAGCRSGAAPRGGANKAAAAGPPMPRDYTVNEIPGVIAAGQKWKSIWTGTGNNADGISPPGTAASLQRRTRTAMS